MILPCYAALERIPDSLLDASSDLGGGAGLTLRRVVLPLGLPGVVAGSIFTFSLTLGDYITPQIVSSTQFIGNVVYTNVGIANNLPLAAAFGGRATRTIGVWQGSAAQQAEEMVPRGVTVVSALHTVSAAALSDPSVQMDEDVLMAGDDRKSKDDVAELIRRIPGLRPVDCGDLERARILEQITALLISINARHKTKHSGIRITGLP